MTGRHTPTFKTLDRAECEAVLTRNTVGRIAFSFHDRVDIEPLHYVFSDSWIYGRTSPGSKLVTLRHSQWVAFEVDEVRGPFDWESVVIHGAFYVISPDGPEREVAVRKKAVELLRALIPETGTKDDPVPFRSVVFRIYTEEMSGRSARTRRLG